MDSKSFDQTKYGNENYERALAEDCGLERPPSLEDDGLSYHIYRKTTRPETVILYMGFWNLRKYSYVFHTCTDVEIVISLATSAMRLNAAVSSCMLAS